MGTIIAIVFPTVIAILISLSIQEIYAWLPNAVIFLFDRAIRRLAPEIQGRYREEWQADLEAMPNSLMKILWAFGFITLVARLNSAHLQRRYESADAVFQELSSVHSLNVRKVSEVRTSKALRYSSIETLERNLEDMLLTAASAADQIGRSRRIGVPIIAKAHSMVCESVKTIGSFRINLLKIVNMASDISDARVEKISAKIDRLDILMIKVERSRLKVKELLEDEKDASYLSAALGDLEDDLSHLRVALDDVENGCVEDEQTTERYERIMAAFQAMGAKEISN
jgi:hypothetical protein